MAKNDLTIKTPTEHDSGAKIHWVDGMPFTCSRGPDCRLCKEDLHKNIKKWLKQIPYPLADFVKWHNQGIPRWAIGKTIEQICKRCKVEPLTCYICIRHECQDWFSEPDRLGQDEGCRWYLDGYCTNWYCSHRPCLIIPNNRWWNMD